MALDLIEAIENLSPTPPFACIGDIKSHAISKLVDIFKQTTYERENRFLFPIVVKDSLKKTTHERKDRFSLPICFGGGS